MPEERTVVDLLEAYALELRRYTDTADALGAWPRHNYATSVCEMTARGLDEIRERLAALRTPVGETALEDAAFRGRREALDEAIYQLRDLREREPEPEPGAHLSDFNDRWNKMALGISDKDVPRPSEAAVTSTAINTTGRDYAGAELASLLAWLERELANAKALRVDATTNGRAAELESRIDALHDVIAQVQARTQGEKSSDAERARLERQP